MASGDVLLKTTGGAPCTLACSNPANTAWRVELAIATLVASVPSTTPGNFQSNVSNVVNGAVIPLQLSISNNGPDAFAFSTSKRYDITITEH